MTVAGKIQIETDPDMFELLPSLEDYFCSDRDSDITRRVVDRFWEISDDAAVLASTIGVGGGGFDLNANEPEFWRNLAKSERGDITTVLFLWQKSVIYRHWAQVIDWGPNALLRYLGE